MFVLNCTRLQCCGMLWGSLQLFWLQSLKVETLSDNDTLSY